MNKSRLHFGIKRYLAEHPRAEILVVEPSHEETLLFVNGPMDLSARAQILDWARADIQRALSLAMTATPRLAALLPTVARAASSGLPSFG